MKNPKLDINQELKPANNAVLGDLIRDYAAIKAEISALEKRLNPIADNLKATVVGMGGRVEVGDLIAQTYSRDNKSYDYEGLLELLGKRDLNKYVKETTSLCLKVTRKL